eukprot:CAMPEP_0204421174 /NCGR_PEP_ID=MMETSP0470-20130426/34378_1 /ASSEMBLY_ACC=CAM_ASM_000385 /TAXON_ID=2969 /ORGANISM="Oxyrrhis marina" /LENGTH=99 /DNA_ID=CAMNT_0051418249 /DNA_START=114 /DNA_END=413 /DNA_ORIENTATION=-
MRSAVGVDNATHLASLQRISGILELLLHFAGAELAQVPSTGESAAVRPLLRELLKLGLQVGAGQALQLGDVPLQLLVSGLLGDVGSGLPSSSARGVAAP